MGAKGATPPAEEDDEPYEDFRKRELMRRYDEQMDRPRRSTSGRNARPPN